MQTSQAARRVMSTAIALNVSTCEAELASYYLFRVVGLKPIVAFEQPVELSQNQVHLAIFRACRVGTGLCGHTCRQKGSSGFSFIIFRIQMS